MDNEKYEGKFILYFFFLISIRYVECYLKNSLCPSYTNCLKLIVVKKQIINN